MKAISFAGLAAVAFTGCLPNDEAPLVTFKQHILAADVIDWKPPDLFPPPDQIQFKLWRFGDTPGDNAAKPGDCVRIEPSTTITANGMAGTLGELGRYDSGSGGIENNCIAPLLYFELTARPATIDVVFDDGSAQLHIGLAIGAEQHYHVTQCDFDACISTLL